MCYDDNLLVFSYLTVITAPAISAAELNLHLTPFDLKRLGAYANNQLDYHVILDLMPSVAMLYFESRLGDNVKPTAVQSAILLALGLQRKSIEDVEVHSFPLLAVFGLLTRH